MTQTNSDELIIEVGDESFAFRKPSARDVARIGARAAALRAQDGDTGDGQLDEFSAALYRASAVMEVLLTSSSADWPFTVGENGTRTVVSENFPTDSTTTLAELQDAFYLKLTELMALSK